MSYEFDSKIKGIPCIIRVLSYYAGTNYTINSASEIDNDPAEFEFEVLHYKTRKHNNWLWDQLTQDDECRILDEYIAEVEVSY